MGKSLQVRGSIQVVDLRTLNAEINEVLKKDVAEVDFRDVRELTLSTGVVDQEISYATLGNKAFAEFVYLTSDVPITMKVNSSLSEGFPTTCLMHFGEIKKLFLSTPTATAKVRIIALAGP